MAQRTNVVATANNGLVRAEIDWNDGNGNMTRFRVINQTGQDALLYALLDPPINGFSRVEVTGVANQTTEGALPNNTASYTKVTDPDTGEQNWSLIGISIFCRWPA